MDNREDYDELYSQEAEEAEKKATLGYTIKKAKSERAMLSYGKPFFTYIFILIQVALFILLEWKGGSDNPSTLIKYGAKFNPYIYAGEWWRFITPIFLHIGLLHMVMNTFFVYFLGSIVEKIFGSFRYLFIYLFAGISGVIASFIFSANISAGASGAIFGCFGAILYFASIYPRIFYRTMGPLILVVLAVQLIFGFFDTSVDNAGHIGGLAGGYLAAGIMHFPKKKKPARQVLFTVLSATIAWGALTYGFSHPAKADQSAANMLLIGEYMKQEKYEQAYPLLKKMEGESENPSAQIYFYLSFTEIKMNLLDDAKGHLLTSIELEPNFPEAYYNLALIHLEQRNWTEAKKYAEKAVSLSQGKQQYSNLVKEINLIIQSSGGEE